MPSLLPPPTQSNNRQCSVACVLLGDRGVADAAATAPAAAVVGLNILERGNHAPHFGTLPNVPVGEGDL
jgi:hypothetical protein